MALEKAASPASSPVGASLIGPEALRRAALERARQRGAVVSRRRLAWRWFVFLVGRTLLAAWVVLLLALAASWPLFQSGWRQLPAVATASVPASDPLKQLGPTSPSSAEAGPPPWLESLPASLRPWLNALRQAWPWKPLALPGAIIATSATHAPGAPVGLAATGEPSPTGASSPASSPAAFSSVEPASGPASGAETMPTGTAEATATASAASAGASKLSTSAASLSALPAASQPTYLLPSTRSQAP